MIVLRQGRPGDEPAVQELLGMSDMGVEIDPRECLLADDEGGIVGLGRIEYGANVPYLRPVTVAPTHQHLGIGRQIVQALLAQVDELRVIARGPSASFYRRLGFAPIDWDQIHAPYRLECAECQEREVCAPVPLRYVLPAGATTRGRDFAGATRPGSIGEKGEWI